jgi:N-acyl-D-aspartate/D-glutamate deacylase
MADVLLFEEGRMRFLLPTVESDLLRGARRLAQKAEGSRATIVNGVITLENGEPTGNYAGEVLKGMLAMLRECHRNESR